jgi:NitT/TauT family transport system ATP-binding protein
MFALRKGAGLTASAAKLRAAAAIAAVRLDRFADAYPHELSGGMKQRVAIARAMAMQPELLLMDEPFAALDALTRQQMQDELIRLWRETGFSLLFVTHSIEEAIIVGSRIVVLSPHPGRVRAEIDVSDINEADRSSLRFQTLRARIDGLLFDEQRHG